MTAQPTVCACGEPAQPYFPDCLPCGVIAERAAMGGQVCTDPAVYARVAAIA